MEEAAGLLTRGSLSHRLPGIRSPGAPVAFRWASNSPHSGGTVPDLHRVPSPRSLVRAEPIIGRCRPAAFRAWVPGRPLGGGDLRVLVDPEPGTGLGTWDLVLRKLAHLSEYAVLGALLLRAIQRPGGRDPRRRALRRQRRDPPALRPRPARRLVRRRDRHGRRHDRACVAWSRLRRGARRIASCSGRRGL